MSKRMLFPTVLAALAWATAGCADDLPLEGRPCPCAGGWECCEDTNVCVRGPAECTLSITPNAERLRIGASLRFSATQPVTWSVDEWGGGSIDSEGRYRAPLRPGTYTVRAKAKSNPSATATARVSVGPTELLRRMGEQGGVGTADGVGRDARFSYPASVAGDEQFLYVSDGPVGDLWWPHCDDSALSGCVGQNEAECVLKSCDLPPLGVRRISLSTTEVTRLVRQRFLRHLAVDHGTLFAATSEVRAGFADIGGPYFGMPHAELREIVSIDPGSEAVATLAGLDEDAPPLDGVGLDARFAGIRGMAADRAGMLYVSDGYYSQGEYHSALRRLDTTSLAVLTLFGTEKWPTSNVPTAPLGSLSTIAFHQGSVYALGRDGQTQALWKYDPSTSSLTKQQSWEVTHPVYSEERAVDGLCFQGDQVISVVGTCVSPLPTSEAQCMFGYLSKSPSGGQLGPRGLWCDGKGTWYVADTQGPTVLKFQASGSPPQLIAGEPAHSGPDKPAPSMRLTHPTALASSASGDVVFFDGYTSPSETAPGTIVRLDASGQLNAHEALSEVYPLRGPLPPIATSGSSALFYATDATKDSAVIARLDLETGQRSKWVTYPRVAEDWRQSGVTSLVHDGLDTLYVASCDAGGIRRVDEAGVMDVLTNEHCGPLAVDGKRRLFVADSADSWADMVAGAVPEYASLVAVDLATGLGRSLPTPSDGWKATALAYDPAGLLYVAEAHRNRVRGLVVETGEVFDVVGKLGSQGVQLGQLPASVSYPVAIALTPTGDLVISDTQENVILEAR